LSYSCQWFGIDDQTNKDVCIGFLFQKITGLKKQKMEEFKDDINLGEQIVKVLKGIYDPEIPVDIHELGLIYDVMINEDNDVKILMTLTSTNCPVAESLPQEVEQKIKAIDVVNSVEIELTFDPPWSRDLMSEEAKFELGML